MNLSQQQSDAFDKIMSWHQSKGKPYFKMNGFAGTGKTTMIKHLRETVGDNIVYLAYTGKAALQLRMKGCDGATTIHQALYDVQEKSTQKLQELLKEFHDASEGNKAKINDEIKKERRRIAVPSWSLNPGDRVRNAPLIVVDEYSMVGSDIFNDLMSLKVPVLFVGDPAQLPPVMSTCPIEDQKPDVMLTEIHRQALDNPLLRAATAVRKGDFSQLVTNGDFVVKDKKQATWEDYSGVDQVLCGRNATRRLMNKRFRAKLGYEGDLTVGEKIIFLRNDHEQGVFNGSMGKVLEDPYFGLDGEVTLTVKTETKDLEAYPAWGGFLQGESELPAGYRGQSVDHAYAITGHKSQGSEWDSVLVHEEVIPSVDHKRLLYTCLTRARKRCVLIR